MKPKQVNTKDTRDRLIEAAIKLFARCGYEATPIRRICDEAGVNVSLVSYHFDGKDGLLRACLERFGDQNYQLAADYLTEPNSPADLQLKLRLFIERFFRLNSQDLALMKIVGREMEKNSLAFQRLLKSTFIETLETIGAFLSKAQTRGFIKSGLDPVEVALMLQGTLVHILGTSHLRKLVSGASITDPDELKKIVSHVETVYCHGLFA